MSESKTVTGCPAASRERQLAMKASWLYGMTVAAAKLFDNGSPQDQDAVGRLLDAAFQLANELQLELDDVASDREFAHRPDVGQVEACALDAGTVWVAKWFDRSSEEKPLVGLLVTPCQARQLAEDLSRAADAAVERGA